MFALSLLGLLLLGGGPETREAGLPKPPAKDFADQKSYEVLRVSAGNLLVVRLDGVETNVRLIGTYIPSGNDEAIEARAFAQRLLEGESVYIDYEPNWPEQRDDDQRVWAYVYRAPDGLFVNLELVRLGYARIAAGERFMHQDLMQAYQRLARRSHKGVWHPRSIGQTGDPPTTEPTGRPGAEPAGRPGAEPTARPGAEPTARPGTGPDGPPGPGNDDGLVYVTPSGKKYHRRDCRHIRASATALTVREAKSRGYTPCAVCKPAE